MPSIKTTIISPVLLFTFSSALLCSSVFAQDRKNTQEQPGKTNPPPSYSEQKKTKNVRVTNIYLKSGKFVTGRLISQDSTKITVAQLEGSRIVVSTYGVRELDLRTRSVRGISEIEYYEELARYFAGRTGDFRDDTDDFIQAIRYYEKAIYLVNESGKKNWGKIKILQDNIEQIRADRQVWIREVTSRAELRKLELQAAFDQAMEQLRAQNNESNENIEQLRSQLDKLGEDLSFLDRDLSWEIQKVEDETFLNKDEIDRMRRMRTSSFYDPPTTYYRPRMHRETRPRYPSPQDNDGQRDPQPRELDEEQN